MKNNRITALLSICLCLILCSCTRSLNLYEVYVCEMPSSSDTDRGDIVYNKADNVYVIPSKQPTVKEGEPDKQFQLGAETITLKYKSTYNKDYCEYDVDSYTDDKFSIRASFRADNGKLESLALDNNKYQIYDGVIDTEAKLMDVCTKYLSEYVDNLDSYVSTIITRIQTMDDHGLNNQEMDGYVSPVAYNNSSVSYQVDFIYCIGEIKTADIISMRIYSNGYLGLLSFNETDAFISFGDCNIDVSRCDQLISSELSKLCNVNKYQYNGYTDEKILIILNNQLCMLSYAEPIYKRTNDMGDFLASPIQLLIPLIVKK